MDKEHMFSCLVKEFQSVLSRSSVTDFTSIYFGGGESFQIYRVEIVCNK